MPLTMVVYAATSLTFQRARTPAFCESALFVTWCQIVKHGHERPGSGGFRSLMTRTDARAC
jgi:hypothetical protein